MIGANQADHFTFLKTAALIVALGVLGCSYEDEPPVGPIEISHDSYVCGPYWSPYGPGYKDSFVIWTPDSSLLLFNYVYARSDPDSPTATVILAVDAAGTQVREIVDAGSGYMMWYGFHADLSPDGQRLVYSSCAFPASRSAESATVFERSDFHYELALIDLDSSIQQRLTESKYTDHYPEWSPDGSRIAFISTRRSGSGAAELYTMAADGSDVQLVASTLKVAHTQDRRTVWYTNAESTRIQGKSAEEVNETESAWLGGLAFAPPAWSPDGERIAFLVDEGRSWPYRKILYTVRVDGTEMTRIAGIAGELQPPHNSGDTALVLPAWSPDGGRLAFVMANEEGKPTGIYTVRPDGTDLRQEIPEWWTADGVLSPDGTRIAFYIPGDAQSSVPPQLYTMARDGADRRDLITLDADGDLAPAHPAQ